MNTPNPLVPQGLLPQTARGKSTVRIAVLTIVAIHAVFFAGLLMQGCKRDDTTRSPSKQLSDLSSQSDLAKLDTNYYQALPESPALTGTTPATGAIVGAGSQTGTTLPAPVAPFPAVTEPSAVTVPTETKEYTIVKNDTLAKIAKAEHISIGELTKANPGIDPRKLKVGQKIAVPAPSRANGTIGTSAAGPSGLGFREPSKPEQGDAAGIHVVKAGETLTKIAKQHGVTIKAIKVANGLRTDRLHVGQKLKVSASTGASATGINSGDSSSTSGTTTLSANPSGDTTVR